MKNPLLPGYCLLFLAQTQTMLAQYLRDLRLLLGDPQQQTGLHLPQSLQPIVPKLAKRIAFVRYTYIVPPQYLPFTFKTQHRKRWP